ncbi:MAG: recombinase family protein [Endomicrobium sp.]|nr:recombinase family protein [Endomicrobium sp.]
MRYKGNRIPTHASQNLHNPIYYGAFQWKGKLYANAKHQPLISKELWNKVREHSQTCIHRITCMWKMRLRCCRTTRSMRQKAANIYSYAMF